MKILICGLGLMGGSMARAFKYYTDHTVFGYDVDSESVRKAILVGACDNADTKLPDIGSFDTVILAAYPRVSVDFLENHAHEIGKGAYVFDLGGVKRTVCDVGFRAAKNHGFTFIGGHPMAGTHLSGFMASRENLYNNSTMILVPPENLEKQKLAFAEELFRSIGFGAVNVTTAKEHDEIIAYTSQLAHVLSNAYVKSPTSRRHKGYSAGSFRDLTRVAHLNPTMWSQLFMDNRDMLISEVEGLASALLEYARAMSEGDEDKLCELLADGSRINDEIKGE